MVQDVERTVNSINTDVPAPNTGNFSSGMGQVSSDAARVNQEMRALQQEIRAMQNEMRLANEQALMPFRRQMLEVEKGFYELANGMDSYLGSTEELISQATELGAQQKKAADAMLNANKTAMVSMLQTIGMMNNMSTTASRISNNYANMGNPLLSANRAGLALANSLEQVANSGSSAQLALELLGPTASMKELQNTMRDIDKQVMAFPMVFGMAAASALMLYGALHSANMEMNPKYAEAYGNMIEKLGEAFNPMKEAFAAVMIPLFNFIAGIADLIIKFNEAHPALAKFIQGTMMLVPALMLILSPLSIGIGYFKGLRAILFSLKPAIMPIITGFAAMSATVWIVAAAIAGLVVGMTHLWKTSETFRNGVMSVVASLKVFGQALLDLGKYLFWAVASGDSMNDWLTHLPKSMQGVAQAIGEALSKVHAFVQVLIDLGKYLFWAAASGDALNDWITHLPECLQGIAQSIGEVLSSINAFGQALVALGKYLLFAALDGDALNDWITHLPEGFQNAAQVIGEAVVSIREGLLSLFEAIKAAFSGDFSQLTTIFATIAPTIVGYLLGGIPAIMIAAARFAPTIAEAITAGMPIILEVINTLITSLVTFFTTALPQLVTIGVQIITNIITGLTQALPIIIESLVTIVTTLMSTLTELISTLLPVLLEAGMQILMALINGITQNLPLIVEAIIQVVTALSDALVQNLPMIAEAGIQILTSLLDGIVSMLPSLIQLAVDLITTIGDMLTQNLPLILDAGIKILMTLIDGIVQMIPQLTDAALNLIMKIYDTIMQNLPKILDAGIKILMALIDGIIQILPQLTNTALDLIIKVTDTLVQNLPKIIDAGVKILMALIDGIIKILPQLVTTIIDITVKILKILWDSLPQMLEAGKKILTELCVGIISIIPRMLGIWDNDLMSRIKTIVSSGFDNVKQVIQAALSFIQGLFQMIFPIVEGVVKIAFANIQLAITNAVTVIKGLVKMVGQLFSGDWKGAFNTAKQIATDIMNNIKSTFENLDLVQIGKNIINGLINGIKSMASGAINAVKNIGSNIKDTLTSFFDIHSPSRVMRDEIGKNIGAGLIIGMLSQKNEVGQAANELARAMQYPFEESKNWIVDKKALKQLSLTDELRAWERVQSRFAEGTKERMEADKEVVRVKKEINDKLLQINEEYVSKAQAINNKLIEQEKAITAEYEKAVANRARSITDFVGLFDKAKGTTELTAEDLLGNLASQVDVVDQWADNIQSLLSRGLDNGLLEELKQMGPKAAGEVAVLAKMTDEELRKYNHLWLIKMEQARIVSTDQMKSMKDDMLKKLDELRSGSAKELALLEGEFATKIAEINTGTLFEFNAMAATLPDIGANAIRGLMQGMEGMRPELMAVAESIANSIKSVIQSALDIHSPSRWMRDMIGVNMMQGWINGMKAMRGAVEQTALEAAEWMRPEQISVQPNVVSGVQSIRGRVLDNGTSRSAQVQNSFQPTVNIQLPDGTSEAQALRKQKRVLRQLGTEMGW
ncbi:hypothetical protein V7183_03550 [Bacillus sp. JJ1127]|uniref:phage tail protein n=1 Tax=Bacillus sp. JJ1127 TaxID=3122952 RepID=UPI002FFEA741